MLLERSKLLPRLARSKWLLGLALVPSERSKWLFGLAPNALEMAAGLERSAPLGRSLVLYKREEVRSKMPSKLLFEEYLLGFTKPCYTTLCCALLVHGYAEDRTHLLIHRLFIA